MLFVIDIKREEIAIKEANRLDIPVVALVDTNCDPDMIDYVIPCNDDAQRSIKLVLETLASAIIQKKNEIKFASGKDDDQNAEEHDDELAPTLPHNEERMSGEWPHSEDKE